MSFLRMWAVALLFPFVDCIATISTVGTKFYDSNGNQFYIKGVVYSETASLLDVLANPAQCQRDIPLMKKLGVNTIRVYYADATQNHDECMQAFEDAGIYVLLGLESPFSGINRATPTWTTAQYNNFTAVMDAFAAYDNTLGFVAGNEVVNDMGTTNAAVYVKASALDLKKYRDGKGYRQIPVGYTGADVAGLMPVLQNYLACGSYGIDFFGQNDYSWCGSSSFSASGYSDEYAAASSYSIPIFFSELGCNTLQPRPFTDQAAILGPDMNNLWSGAIVYEWAEEVSDYGLVSYVSVLSGTPTPIASAGFSNLMSQWATLTPTGTPSSLYTPNVTPPACPSSTASGWLINGNPALPTLNKAAVSSPSKITNLPSLTTSTSTGKTSSSSTSSSKETGPAAAVGSGTAAGKGSLSTSDPAPTNGDAGGGGLSTGAIAGIAIGIVALLVAAAVAVFLLWRRRRKQQASPPLDLTPDGLEVGEPPPKPELYHSEIAIKPELQDTSSTLAPNNGSTMHSSPATTTSTLSCAELGSSPISRKAIPVPSELSSTPKLANAQPQPAPVTPSPASGSNGTPLKSNAPWENEEFPYPQAEITATQAQKTPLLSENDGDDELRRLEEEERRIDTQIAESERIRALKEEKLALQAKKMSLLAAKEKAGRT